MLTLDTITDADAHTLASRSAHAYMRGLDAAETAGDHSYKEACRLVAPANLGLAGLLRLWRCTPGVPSGLADIRQLSLELTSPTIGESFARYAAAAGFAPTAPVRWLYDIEAALVCEADDTDDILVDRLDAAATVCADICDLLAAGARTLATQAATVRSERQTGYAAAATILETRATEYREGRNADGRYLPDGLLIDP